MKREEILDLLTKLDFMTYDLGLYLDTHPKCEKGLALYNKIAEKAKELREEYETAFGGIRTGCPNPSSESWLWIDEPFPWEKNMSNPCGCMSREVNC